MNVYVLHKISDFQDGEVVVWCNDTCIIPQSPVFSSWNLSFRQVTAEQFYPWSQIKIKIVLKVFF